MHLTTPPAARAQAISFCDSPAHCASCPVREVCLPSGLDARTVREMDAVFGQHMRVKKREVLYRAGEVFTTVYAIRAGSFKTLVLARDGREQVIGQHMGGDVVGLDGLGAARHACDAVALEDSEVCPLPFAKLDKLTATFPGLRSNVFSLIARESSRGQEMMVLLGSMRAEERLAALLLNLSGRYHRRGYSASEFTLRMTRQEIASYLGLTLETISRLFTRLRDAGFIQIQGRAIKLLDSAALVRLAGPTT